MLLKKYVSLRKAKLHPANVQGMKELYKNYLNGENVIIACDLVPHQKGTYSKLFNKPCFSIDLIEKLSKKDTHDLHFVFLTRGKNKKYKFNLETINRPISTDEMNIFFEKAISKAPELYGWEYKKFRKLMGERKISINFSKKKGKIILKHQTALTSQQSLQKPEYIFQQHLA